MGTRWGVNRTVAQVHALLYISPEPLNADDIVEALEVARSNVSTSLKELQGWGIVRLADDDCQAAAPCCAASDVRSLAAVSSSFRCRRQARARSLGVSDEHLLDEMRVRLNNGAVFGGASALVAIARRIWWAWPLWALSRVPGAMLVLGAAYRWMARNRHCLNGTASDTVSRSGCGP